MYTIEPMKYTIDKLDNSADVSVVQNIFWALVCWVSSTHRYPQFCEVISISTRLIPRAWCLSTKSSRRCSKMWSPIGIKKPLEW